MKFSCTGWDKNIHSTEIIFNINAFCNQIVVNKRITSVAKDQDCGGKVSGFLLIKKLAVTFCHKVSKKGGKEFHFRKSS